MIALIIIIAVLLFINLVPIGVDGGYEDGAAFGYLKIGLFHKRVFPQPELTDEEKRLAEAKKKARKEAKAANRRAKAEKEAAKRIKKGLPPEEPKKKLDMDLLLELARMGLHALKRFRRRLSIDLFKLHFTAGGDPYSAAMSYGYASAAFGIVLPLIDDAVVIHDRDVQVGVDFDAGGTKIDARLIMTIQLWEIMYVALAFGAEFIKYTIKNRRKEAKTDGKTPDAA